MVSAYPSGPHVGSTYRVRKPDALAATRPAPSISEDGRVAEVVIDPNDDGEPDTVVTHEYDGFGSFSRGCN